MIKPLDTHSAIKELTTKTGMDARQAETFVEVMKGLFVGDLATKADVKDVVQETTLVRSEIKDLRVDIAEFKTEVKTEIAEFKIEVKGDIAELRNEMSEFKAEVKGDIAEFKAEVKGDIAVLRNEISEFKTEVKTEIGSLKSDLTWVKRLLMVGVITLMSATAKYIFFS